MRRSLGWCLCAGCWLAAGCNTAYMRAPRQIGMVEGLAYSNSPVVIEEREPVRTAAGLEVRYAVLLANHADFAVTVELAQVQASTDGETGTATARCGTPASPGNPFELAPKARARVECALRLTALGHARLRQGDRDLQLSIPIRAPQGTAELRFSYALRMEDAT